MKYHGGYTTPEGKSYVSYESDKVASLAQRWTMFRVAWQVSHDATPKIRFRLAWIMFKYVINPTSHAYYYKPVEDS